MIVGLMGVLFLFRTKSDNPLVIKVKGFVSGLKDGLLTVLSLKNKTVGFILISIAIWVGYLLNFYLCLLGIPGTEGVSLSEGYLVLMFSGLAMMAPVQGGIGAMHWMVMQALVIVGLTAEVGLAAATILHASNIALVIVAGAISTIFISFNHRLS